ncbi:hypothetical protein DB346_07780 [Verrucomicrobia bacterium LW23]|nr:hypothetical protein DB346_07780 [Verrucomicrobia bacterium LW23]
MTNLRPRPLRAFFAAIVLALGCSPAEVQAQSRTSPPPAAQKLAPLTDQANLPEAAKKALQKRLDVQLNGSLADLAGRLYSLADVAVTTSHAALRDKSLTSAHYKGYKPTVEELLDQVQRQTRATFTFHGEKSVWMLNPPAPPRPISITLPTDWTSVDKGMYLACKPEGASYALDIYMLGKYSAAPGEKLDDILKRARESAATMFIAKITPAIRVADMRTETIAGIETLYCEAIAPQSGMKWRQWVFTAGNRCYAIGCALRPEQDSVFYPQVQQMLKTLSINE